jgi:predicted O-linked N-acetylglucosamine transferase (SPINDLY family)
MTVVKKVYRDGGDHKAALKVFEMALEIDPGDLVAVGNALQVYGVAGVFGWFDLAFTKSRCVSPSEQARRTLCGWRGMEALQDTLLASVHADLSKLLHESMSTSSSNRRARTQPPLLPYDGLLMAGISLADQRLLANMNAAAWMLAGCSDSRRKLDWKGPLRVMYVSFDFRDHPMGYLTQVPFL